MQRQTPRHASTRLALVAALPILALCPGAFGGNAPIVTGLTLINADTDTPIAGFDPIPDGALLNLAVLPTRNLNIRADTNPSTVGSVVFGFQGDATFRTENGAPYAMFGDAGGDFLPWTPEEGVFSASATAYELPNASGAASPIHAVNFTVADYLLDVDAGPDLEFEAAPQFITLSGTVNPADAEDVTLTWMQLAGPPVTFDGSNHLPANIGGLSDSDAYVFRIIAMDALGSTADDLITVTIGTPIYPWEISGEQKQWHPVTITFEGPYLDETDTPNPFTDYRLNATFTNGVDTMIIPGYFAADGNAAETGATAGNKWRVHFTPPTTGIWFFTASFRQGPGIAISQAINEGGSSAFDGTIGSFSVAASDKTGRDHRAKGMLRYTDAHYLQFAGTGEYFLKGGADSPENFLAYADFDDTIGTHAYAPHVADWLPGDPLWKGNRGHGIVGALNYLAGKGMNSVYFLTMNVQGDGNDVWPWISPTQRVRYDVSRLDQWDIVLSHMDRLGLSQHVVTQETENDQLLDGGELDIERRVYYRELIARFGHHLGVIWNLGEENTNTDAQRAAFIDFFSQNDPYDHPVVIHTAPGAKEIVYAPLLGNDGFEGASLQIANNFIVSEWVDRSAAAGRPWVVCYDEQAPAMSGVIPDADDFWHDTIRKEVLWGTLMGGGAGVEYYFGYDFPNNDLNCEDWRSRDNMWTLTDIALDFFHFYLPFWQMRHANELTSAGGVLCFAEDAKLYAIYLPDGQPTSLNLEAHPGEFSVRWFNPRLGGPLQTGDTLSISGPGSTPIGLPPQVSPGDWVALIQLCPCGCGGDMNADGKVDGDDIAGFVACATGSALPTECLAADLNQDSFIDASDVAMLTTALLCSP